MFNGFFWCLAELHRLYAALVLAILMALCGIFQLIMHFLMSLKSGRAIFLQINYVGIFFS